MIIPKSEINPKYVFPSVKIEYKKGINHDIIEIGKE
jgi:hypothetical protein